MMHGNGSNEQRMMSDSMMMADKTQKNPLFLLASP
jgi:hypothetical protein